MKTLKMSSESESRSVVSHSSGPMDCIVHGILEARILEWVAFRSPGDLPNTGIKPRSPLQADPSPDEPQGKPKNTAMGSLSLLQQVFPTHESNQGLLHCRWILYQLSHKGSPRILQWVVYPFSSGSSQPRNQSGSPAWQVDSLSAEQLGKPLGRG